MSKRLIIVRGLSGSGKSTLAGELKGETGVVLSTDDFFIDPQTGKYNYNTRGLNKAHIWNQERARIEMEKGTSPVIIDNMNLQAWEPQPYVLIGRDNGYDVEIVEPSTPWKIDTQELAKRSKHGVTPEALEKLKEKMENYTITDILKAESPEVTNSQSSKKERQKISQKLEKADKSKDSLVTTTTTTTTTTTSQSNNMVVEFTNNDGQKSVFKPIIVKPDTDWDTLTKQACNSLKLRIKKNARVFTLTGEEINGMQQLQPQMKLCISPNGNEFVPIALKKTAAEKRAFKQSQMQSNNEEIQEKPKTSINMRRYDKIPLGMNEILDDFLFVGSGRDSHTLSQLKENKITHIVNVAKEWPPLDNLPDTIKFHHVQLEDTEDEDILKELEPIVNLIENIREQKGRVLLHCVIGKSRSPSIAIAYIMIHMKKSLQEAYDIVLRQRPISAPNTGFIRQLMELEHNLTGRVTLDWLSVPSRYKTLHEWLQANSEVIDNNNTNVQLHNAKDKVTHLWWEVIYKQKLGIHPKKFEELFSECARAIVDRNELVKLVEICGPRYKLHIDIDVKLTEKKNNQRLIDIYELFIPAFNHALNTLFPNDDHKHVVTASSSHFASSNQPEIQWKYGFHVIWPHIVIDKSDHIKFAEHIFTWIKDNQHLFPEDVRKYNDIKELVDVNVVENEEHALRMLYSMKSVSCKYCRKKDAVKKKDKKKSQISRESICKFCFKTGMLDSRVHRLLSIYSKAESNAIDTDHMKSLGIRDPKQDKTFQDDDKDLINDSKDLSTWDIHYRNALEKEVTTRIVRDRLMLCSIISQPSLVSIYKEHESKDSSPSNTIGIPRITSNLTPEEAMKVFVERRTEGPEHELETIQYLQNHTIGELCKKYTLKSSRHQTHLNLVQLSYSQTGSPVEDPLVQECRGLVLDTKNSFKVVCFPYKKFFNFGESNAHPINWQTAQVYEKIDGSLAVLYHYKDEWHVSSSSIPDGSGTIAKDMTFAQLFWNIWKSMNYTLPMDTKCSYMFEMVSKHNPIVVKPQRECIILHGVRDNITYQEIDPDVVAVAHGWESVPKYHFTDISNVVDHARTLSPSLHEGYVVCDDNWNRVKIKSPQYVSLSHINSTSSMNKRNMLEIVRSNEGSEFLVHFPQYRDLYNEVNDSYQKLIEKIQYHLSSPNDVSGSTTSPPSNTAPPTAKQQGKKNQKKNQKQHQTTNQFDNLIEDLKKSPLDLREFLCQTDINNLYKIVEATAQSTTNGLN
eukprot:TRINITY_DN2304_c0_g1_i1.p1 TRINITY_DN2304_c0_g1~~TRINITY_DN2304_c0_g1_i1.p1  ORF type:complete len:1245 (+),score=308.37 TRINITY_DN2304_c0_g1_i1:1-3735(+)